MIDQAWLYPRSPSIIILTQDHLNVIHSGMNRGMNDIDLVRSDVTAIVHFKIEI